MYMNVIYIDKEGNGRTIGVGAEFDTPEETKQAFESLKPIEADIKTANFICDLHDENGDLVDTVALSDKTYTHVTGEPILSDAAYIALDKAYWESQKAA